MCVKYHHVCPILHQYKHKVSCTVTFDPVSEAPHIPAALAHFQYMLKGISFLPRPINHKLLISSCPQENSGSSVNNDITSVVDDQEDNVTEHPYPQMPYERITKSQYEAKIAMLSPFSLRGMKGVSDREMPDLFCENDRCDVPVK